MAVITKIDLKQVQNICKDLNLNIISLEPIIQGTENSSFLIKDDTAQKYIFTIFEQGDIKDINFISKLQIYLKKNNLPVLAPRQNAAGAYFTMYSGKPCLVFDFAKGYQIQETNLFATKEVAKYLAHQHLLTANFGDYKPHLRYISYLQKNLDPLKPFLTSEDYNLMAEEIQIYIQKLANADLPQAVLHGDLFRDNVFFVDDNDKKPKISAIIDFYNSCTGIRLYDLAVLVDDWCLNAKGEIDMAAYNAIVEEYRKIAKLTETEERLLPLILRLVATRYWISRLLVVHLEPCCDRVAKDPNHFKNLLKNLKNVFA